MSTMLATRWPMDELSFTNCAIINPNDFSNNVRHIVVSTGPNQDYVFTVRCHHNVPSGMIAFNFLQRKWAILPLKQEIEVKPYIFNPNSEYLCTIVVEADFLKKHSTTLEAYDADQMAKDFQKQFSGQAFTVGQKLVFQFKDKAMLSLVVKNLEAVDLIAINDGIYAPLKKTQVGCCLEFTVIQFEKAPNSSLNLVNKEKEKNVYPSIIHPDWDFDKMGIGCFNKEFSAIFKRAFASRVYPPEVVTQLELKHVKGMLLYGPPGICKSFIVRQMVTILNAREPKIVNSQILNKYIKQSKDNIETLFSDAEKEERSLGPNSRLHIIVLDEIDAICKSRSGVVESTESKENTEIHNTVVNQLLEKIDGTEQLNNILVIGMTNRRFMIDEALLKPGRLEVQIEISLLDENEKFQILNLHTSKMRNHKKMALDDDLKDSTDVTENLNGADLEGLVGAIQNIVMDRIIKSTSKVEADSAMMEKLMISRSDFLHTLESYIKPVLDTSTESLNMLLTRGIISWSKAVTEILFDSNLYIQEARCTEGSGLISVLLEGPFNSGKTALAAQIAKNSDFPFIKVCKPKDMIGYTESAKCLSMQKIFDDAYRSELSCILIDNIERLLDYCPIGPRYSNLVLQTLLVLLKEPPPHGHKLLILCTTSEKEFLEELKILSAFSITVHVPNLSTPGHVLKVLNAVDLFNKEELLSINMKLKGKRIFIGIKKLLRLIDMTRQVESKYRVPKFLSKLKEEITLEKKYLNKKKTVKK